MKYRVIRNVLLAAVALLVAGCDVAPNVRIGGTPIGGGPTALDPENPKNVAVYFYTDHPVAGLNFVCAVGSTIVESLATDETGRAVCPRNSKITFFVGDIKSATLVLGSIELKIFGSETSTKSDGRRNYVAVTPGTLFGTTASSSTREVVNIVNLLYTLDVARTQPARHAIYLPAEPLGKNVHAAFSAQLADPTLALSLSSSPSTFKANIEQVAAAIQSSTSSNPPESKIVFYHSGNALSVNTADPGNAYEVADKAITAARAGIYRAAALVIADSTGKKQFTPTVNWLVTRNGDILGIGNSLIIDQTGSSAVSTYEHMSMQPGAKVGPDGLLSGVNMVDDSNSFEMDITGRLVNDFMYGIDTRLNPETNTLVPPDGYVFSASDVGNIKAGSPSQVSLGSPVFDGGLGASPGEATLPDIDLSLLPSSLLPLNLAIGLKGYPDGTKATDAERSNPALWQVPPVSSLLFTIQPNGEIVSDIDGDCAAVTNNNGVLTDADGSPEYVIGQVGPVFRDDANNSYITLLLAVYEPSHPAYGFTLGFAGEYMLGQSVVYDVSQHIVRRKSCAPDALDTCEPPEWFNDVIYTREVVGPQVAAGTSADPNLAKRNDYYGRVVSTAPACVI